jgi:hypothetical protein
MRNGRENRKIRDRDDAWASVPGSASRRRYADRGKVRLGKGAETNTRDACAPQTIRNPEVDRPQAGGYNIYEITFIRSNFQV